MAFRPMAIFERDMRHDGVRRINVYLMRLVFVLMFFVLGKDCWTKILTHKGPWEPYVALAWCVWTGFAMVAGFLLVLSTVGGAVGGFLRMRRKVSAQG